ncbi:MAG: F0F1 ATP synthase subunit A [Christensenellales bacterium]|jgi:F-type H+-transporting ATPase subunit a
MKIISKANEIGKEEIPIKNKKAVVIVWICVILALFVGVLLIGTPAEKHETVQEMMRDAVLHESNHIELFGIKDVNPAFASAVLITTILLIVAALIRIFAIPKFRYIPNKIQLVLEQIVGFFYDFVKKNSPHRHRFLGAYIFGAGIYIFFGTLFELLGLQAITTVGASITLPAPLSDINGAIALGCLSYLIILMGGLFSNGIRGLGSALKDFSMPLSMSFRLFGALLSGVLVTELIYYYFALSFVLPIIVGVLFTLLHALVQTYVLIMLTASSYGEVSKPRIKEDHALPASGELDY